MNLPVQRADMNHLVDDAARILASPIPRRRMLRMLGGLIAGGLLGTVGIKRANAATCSPACKPGQLCCPGVGGPAFCIAAGKLCCGSSSCNAGQTCCNGPSGSKICSPAGGFCCGTTTCNAGQTCCGSGASAYCIAAGKLCCGTGSCNAGQQCCGTGTSTYCSPSGGSCCGNTGPGCSASQHCCGNMVCLPTDVFCRVGRHMRGGQGDVMDSRLSGRPGPFSRPGALE